MKKIKFFSDFCDSTHCKDMFIKIYNLESSLLYNHKYIFTDGDDYTHAIILNKATPNLNIPKENVIGLACEPPSFLCLTRHFINYCEKHISKYYIGDVHNLPDCFIEKYAYLWHVTPLRYIPIKNKLMSIMVSIKQTAPGHKYRHKLTKSILKTNLPIDIYGNGCKYYTRDNRLKGEFEEYEPYENYKFHICIENFQENHYFSEKITNTLLCYTTPVYLGCKNIDNYFPNSVIKLVGNIDDDIKLLESICLNPDKYIKNINQTNIIETINIENLIGEFI